MWEIPLGERNKAARITYELDGKQYIAIPGGRAANIAAGIRGAPEQRAKISPSPGRSCFYSLLMGRIPLPKHCHSSRHFKAVLALVLRRGGSRQQERNVTLLSAQFHGGRASDHIARIRVFRGITRKRVGVV